eukprot:TRINITY_DN62826_c0_g1_i1.p1 TRINITY_DN62826_c0_g1~~TRINITY_DN62826_c0_g1_i1.p1  ORF type:complete len:748 (-),score=53.37 TRINITY_DN62826_c0_g1_i1:1513-3756(-)
MKGCLIPLLLLATLHLDSTTGATPCKKSSPKCLTKYLATTFVSGDACKTAATALLQCLKDENICSDEHTRMCALFQRRNCAPVQCGGAAYHSVFLSSIDPARVKNNSQFLSSRPHLAGTPQDKVTAQEAERRFKAAGMETKIDEFPVLLSYPLKRSLEITAPAAEAKTFTIEETEEPSTGQKYWDEAAPPFNGFSASGDVTGEVVFANYGRYEDYDAIKSVDLKGKIVICRYGRIFRGTKVQLAEARGAVGVLIYLDPADVGPAKGAVYPKGPWANNSTVQRGTVYVGNGDPLTPGWPSVPGGPIRDMKDVYDADTPAPATPLPTIPSQPIGAEIAAQLLKGLTGNPLPNKDWATYGITNIGPGPRQVKLSVKMNTTRTNIWNVFGRVEGAVEPDRVVYMGVHRDAWTYGTVDPISGQAIMWEIAEVVGQMLKAGWRPRRTIQFCSWDAEEYGLMGSMEYVEKQISQLLTNAVVYLNMDTAIESNQTITCRGVPSLLAVVNEVLSEVSINSTTSAQAIFRGGIGAPGGGSDHGGFIRHATVTVGELRFRPDKGQPDPYGAVYHSNYDSMYWVENFADPGWKAHGQLAQAMGLLLLKFADKPVLPFSLTDYTDFLAKSVTKLAKQPGVVVTSMQTALKRLQTVTASIAQQQADLASKTETSADWATYRALNDKLMYFERVWRGDKALTGNEYRKHVLFAPAKYNSYAGTTFPAVTDALFEKDVKKANFLIQRLALYFTAAADYLTDSL